MSPPSGSGIVQSVHDRLKSAAKERGRPFAELLELYAIEGLSDAFARDPLHATRWSGFLAKGQLQVDAADFLGVVAEIRRFAQPLLDAVREERTFDRHWPPGGPWRGRMGGEG